MQCQWWPAIKSRHPLEMLVETVTRLRHVEATNKVLQSMVLQQAQLVEELQSSHSKQHADNREASDEMDAVASLQLLAKQQVRTSQQQASQTDVLQSFPMTRG